MKALLALGWITANAFILGTFILGSQLEGYSMVSQTVSEIGEKGSPLYIHWQIFSIGKKKELEKTHYHPLLSTIPA